MPVSYPGEPSSILGRSSKTFWLTALLRLLKMTFMREPGDLAALTALELPVVPTVADVPEWFVRDFPKLPWRSGERVKWCRIVWLAWFGDVCWSCGQKMVPAKPKGSYSKTGYAKRMNAITADHILSKAFGGRTALDNITCICEGCNCHKSDFESRVANHIFNERNWA